MTKEPNEPYIKIANLDRMVHDPSRLAILTVLSSCKEADFTFLLNMTGLTKGNLSSHISKLEEHDLVSVRKEFKSKKPITFIQLTKEGTKAINDHWKMLEKLRKASLPPS